MIKRIVFTGTFLITIFSFTTAQNRDFYALTVYSFENEDQIEYVDEYLEDAYIPALKKQGIKNVGVFKTRDAEEVNLPKLYVLIPFNQLNHYEKTMTKLFTDETFLRNGADYLEADHDDPPYKRMETILLKAFIDMPNLAPSPLDGPREDRIYELRSYESATELDY